MPNDQFAKLVERARQNPDFQKTANGAFDPIADVMDYGQKTVNARQRGAAPAIPQPLAMPTPVVVRKAPAEPGATGTELQNLAAAMYDLLAEVRAQNAHLLRLQRMSVIARRMDWARDIGSVAQAPDRTDLALNGTLVAGGGRGLAFYTGTTFLPYYRNVGNYPIGVRIRVFWNTPGGILNISRSSNLNGVVATLENGGPNGGTRTEPIKLLPNATLFAANGDGGVPLSDSDVAIVQILDPKQYLDPNSYPVEPWPGA